MFEPYPAMPIPHQDAAKELKWVRRSFSAMFSNTEHLADSLLFIRSKQQEPVFLKAISEVLMKLHPSVTPSLEAIYRKSPPGGIRVVFSPDSRVRPSFRWKGIIAPAVYVAPDLDNIVLMRGALLYRDTAGWSIHT